MGAERTLRSADHAAGRSAARAYLVAAVVIGLDQGSKWWVLTRLALDRQGSLPLAPPWLRLTYVANPGVSYGLLRADGAIGRWLLVMFSLGVALGLAVWAWRTVQPLAILAVGLIMGGAIGNAIDRARLGVVTDFIDASGLHFPWVFNAADSAITAGVICLLLDGLLAPKTP